MSDFRRLASVGLLLVTIGCFQSCVPESTCDEDSRVTKVRIHRVEQRAIAQEISSFGSISFKQKTDLSPLVDGVVTEVPIVDGIRVAKDQIMLRMRNPQLEMRRTQAQAAVNQAKAAQNLAESQLWSGTLQVEARITDIAKAELELAQKRQELAELERALKNKQALLDAGGTTEETINNLKMTLSAQRTASQSLQKDLDIKRIGLRDSDLLAMDKSVPTDPKERLAALTSLNTSTLRAEIDGAKSRVESAESELAAIDALLAELTIRSPAAGIVGAKQAEVGEYIQAATKVITLINTETIYAVFPVPERDAVKLREGMPVSVSLDAFPGREFSARLDLVAPLIDAQSGAMSVKAILGNASQFIKPGMFARVKVELGLAVKRAVVPESALVRKEGDTARVLSVVNGRVFAKDLKLEKDLGGEWIVLEGCRPGDLLIDEPSPLLQEGSEVAQ